MAHQSTPPRVKRKAPPPFPCSTRYPEPDPSDPFAPLWVLRNRSTSTYGALTTLAVADSGDERDCSIAISPPPESPLAISRKQFILTPDAPDAATEAAYLGMTSDEDRPPTEHGHHKKSKRRPRPWRASQLNLTDPQQEPHYRRRSQSVFSPTDSMFASSPNSPYGFYGTTGVRPSLTKSQSSLSAQSLCLSANNGDENIPSFSLGRSNANTNAHESALASVLVSCTRKVSIDSFTSRPKFSRMLRARNSSRTSLAPIPNPSNHRETQSESECVSSGFASPFLYGQSKRATATLPRTLSGMPSFGSFASADAVSVLDSGYRSQPESLSRVPSGYPSVRLHEKSSRSLPLKAGSPLREVHSTVMSESALPTRSQLLRAAELTVIAENGVRVRFGDIFMHEKTIVCFIRHFWCAACQDYMTSISQHVDASLLRKAGLNLVVVGNGSPAMIKSYRQIFRTPFSLYTDPSLTLYNALGMTLRTTDHGSELERGEYIRHGVLAGIAMVVRRALRVGMPVWEKGGDVAQLGGEFVLGPGLACSYAHRMRTTRSHAPIRTVLEAAGMHSEPAPLVAEPFRPVIEEDPWMVKRRESYLRLEERRRKRRTGACSEHEHEHGHDYVPDAVPALVTDHSVSGSSEGSDSSPVIREESDVDAEWLDGGDSWPEGIDIHSEGA